MVTVGRHRGLVPSPRSGADDAIAAADLQTLYDRYRAVSSRLAPDLNSSPEVAYARAALIHALLQEGWKAPEVVHERLRADEEVLRPRLVIAS